jgi:hypothetical protein
MSLDKHKALTAVRARAYGDLFGCTPSAVFPPHDLFKKPDERFLIDIFVYTLEAGSVEVRTLGTSSTHGEAPLNGISVKVKGEAGASGGIPS